MSLCAQIIRSGPGSVGWHGRAGRADRGRSLRDVISSPAFRNSSPASVFGVPCQLWRDRLVRALRTAILRTGSGRSQDRVTSRAGVIWSTSVIGQSLFFF